MSGHGDDPEEPIVLRDDDFAFLDDFPAESEYLRDSLEGLIDRLREINVAIERLSRRLDRQSRS